jgi:hypothetical protein
MFSEKLSIGRVLGHMTGVVGVTIGVDPVLSALFTHYVRLYPYRHLTAGLLSILLIALGARVIQENPPRRKWKGPWGGV